MKIITKSEGNDIHIEFIPETTLEEAIVTGIDCSSAKIYRDEDKLQIDAKHIDI